MGFAASLYNLMRNTGAAVGISYLMTTLIRHEQVHQSILVGHFSVFDAWRLSQSGPQMPGATPFSFAPEMITGQKQGLGMIYGMIQAQAAMLSFNDIYRMLALIAVLLVPSFLFIKRVQASADTVAH